MKKLQCCWSFGSGMTHELLSSAIGLTSAVPMSSSIRLDTLSAGTYIMSPSVSQGYGSGSTEGLGEVVEEAVEEMEGVDEMVEVVGEGVGLGGFRRHMSSLALDSTDDRNIVYVKSSVAQSGSAIIHMYVSCNSLHVENIIPDELSQPDTLDEHPFATRGDDYKEVYLEHTHKIIHTHKSSVSLYSQTLSDYT